MIGLTNVVPYALWMFVLGSFGLSRKWRSIEYDAMLKYGSDTIMSSLVLSGSMVVMESSLLNATRDWASDLYVIVGSINSHSPSFFGIYYIEWLIVRPLNGIINFSYSANFTNYGSSSTDFFYGYCSATFFELCMSNGKIVINNALNGIIVLNCYLKFTMIINVIIIKYKISVSDIKMLLTYESFCWYNRINSKNNWLFNWLSIFFIIWLIGILKRNYKLYYSII